MHRKKIAHRVWLRASLWTAPLLFLVGCAPVSETSRTQPVSKIRQAKTATPDELRALARELGDHLESIQCTALDLDAQAGNWESEKIERYRSAPGYLFVARPKQIRLKVLVPVVKNTLFDMASDGQVFQIWYPRENKFFTGSTGIRRLRYEGVEKNPLSRFRPQHLVDALLFEKVADNSAGMHSFIHEDGDAQAKYYVMGFVAAGAKQSPALIRRIWIERSELRVVRQQYYDPNGSLQSDISYADYRPVGGIIYPTTIRLERPHEQFSIALRLKSLKINGSMDANTFFITRPSTVDWVELKSEEPPSPAEQ